MTGAAISFAVLLTAGLTLGIPLIIIGVLLYQVAAAAVLIPVLAGIVLLIVLILGVSMPIRTYMKFYALRNYHDITA
jgi:hypothetical protein